MSATATQPTVVQQSIHYLPVDSLRDDDLLKGLYKPIDGQQWSNFTSSVNKNGGCRVPILVVRVGNKYFIWDGYQRVRAHRELGIDRIPCFLLPGGHQMWGDEQKVLWAADMNEHRRHDLTIVGRALLYLASVGKPGRKTDESEDAESTKTTRQTAAEPKSAPEGANSNEAKNGTDDDAKTSAEEAAEDAGFGSTRTAQKAAKVAKLGCLEVREALSAEHITLNEAYEIVTKNGPPAQADALVKLQRSKAEHKASKKRSSNGSAKQPRESKTSVEEVALPLAAAINSLAKKFDKAKVFVTGDLAPERVSRIVKHLRGDLEAEDRGTLRANVMSCAEALNQFVADMGDWS